MLVAWIHTTNDSTRLWVTAKTKPKTKNGFACHLHDYLARGDNRRDVASSLTFFLSLYCFSYCCKLNRLLQTILSLQHTPPIPLQQFWFEIRTCNGSETLWHCAINYAESLGLENCALLNPSTLFIEMLSFDFGEQGEWQMMWIRHHQEHVQRKTQWLQHLIFPNNVTTSNLEQSTMRLLGAAVQHLWHTHSFIDLQLLHSRCKTTPPRTTTITKKVCRPTSFYYELA